MATCLPLNLHENRCQEPGNRGSRPDVRKRVSGPDQLTTGCLRRTRRPLRPDHHVPVPEQGVSLGRLAQKTRKGMGLPPRARRGSVALAAQNGPNEGRKFVTESLRVPAGQVSKERQPRVVRRSRYESIIRFPASAVSDDGRFLSVGFPLSRISRSSSESICFRR
jgi:hypothetical protein